MAEDAALAASAASLPAVRAVLYGPARTGLLAFLLLAVTALAGVLLLNVNHVQRLGQILQSVDHLHRVQSVGLELTRLQLGAAEGASLQGDDVAQLHAALQPFLDPTQDLAPASAALFREASDVLLATDKPLSLRVALAQRALRDATFSELGAGSGQLEVSVADARRQTGAALLIFVLLPVAGLLVFLHRQRRVASALASVQGLLTGLASGQLHVVVAQTTDPVLQSLFATYNRAVGRLAELERAHRDQARSLQDQVHEATQQVMAQQGALARSERLAAVGELAATVAHELRNPLAGIQVAVSNISEGMVDPALRARATMVVQECQRMARLLTELLASARPPVEPQDRVNLRALLEQFAALARFQAPPGVSLVVEAPAALWLDVPAEGLRQALLNLTLNAFQAMREQNGQVRLQAAVHGPRLVITVCDEGPGFSEQVLRQGPQAFRSGREGGTGLGLAVVQRFVQSHAGSLVLDNAAAGGACVTLTVPCRRSASQEGTT